MAITLRPGNVHGCPEYSYPTPLLLPFRQRGGCSCTVDSTPPGPFWGFAMYRYKVPRHRFSITPGILVHHLRPVVPRPSGRVSSCPSIFLPPSLFLSSRLSPPPPPPPNNFTSGPARSAGLSARSCLSTSSNTISTVSNLSDLSALGVPPNPPSLRRPPQDPDFSRFENFPSPSLLSLRSLAGRQGTTATIQ